MNELYYKHILRLSKTCRAKVVNLEQTKQVSLQSGKIL